MRPSLDLSKATPYHITPGYHGELWVAPATGTILRITVDADLMAGDPVGQADTLIEYGPVSIGDSSYICPVRSLTLRMNAINPNDMSGTGPLLELNQTRFNNYHRFASTARILVGNQLESLKHIFEGPR